MKRVASYTIAVLLLSACSINTIPRTLTSLVEAEVVRLPSDALPVESREVQLLDTVLSTYGLPRTRARLLVFPSIGVSAQAGVSGNIYLSKGLIDRFRSTKISEATFVAIIAHELHHIVWQDGLRLAPSPDVRVTVVSPAIVMNMTLSYVIAKHLAKGNDSTAKIWADALQTSAALSGVQNPSVAEPATMAEFSLFPVGYRYPLGLELSADAAARSVLHKLGYPTDSLAPFLQIQEHLLTLLDPKNDTGLIDAIRRRQ